jgi:hypothetical protein
MRTDQGNFKASCLLLRNGSTDVVVDRIPVNSERNISFHLRSMQRWLPVPGRATARTERII